MSHKQNTSNHKNHNLSKTSKIKDFIISESRNQSPSTQEHLSVKF